MSRHPKVVGCAGFESIELVIGVLDFFVGIFNSCELLVDCDFKCIVNTLYSSIRWFYPFGLNAF